MNKKKAKILVPIIIVIALILILSNNSNAANGPTQAQMKFIQQSIQEGKAQAMREMYEAQKRAEGEAANDPKYVGQPYADAAKETRIPESQETLWNESGYFTLTEENIKSWPRLLCANASLHPRTPWIYKKDEETFICGYDDETGEQKSTYEIKNSSSSSSNSSLLNILGLENQSEKLEEGNNSAYNVAYILNRTEKNDKEDWTVFNREALEEEIGKNPLQVSFWRASGTMYEADVLRESILGEAAKKYAKWRKTLDIMKAEETATEIKLKFDDAAKIESVGDEYIIGPLLNPNEVINLSHKYNKNYYDYRKDTNNTISINEILGGISSITLNGNYVVTKDNLDGISFRVGYLNNIIEKNGIEYLGTSTLTSIDDDTTKGFAERFHGICKYEYMNQYNYPRTDEADVTCVEKIIHEFPSTDDLYFYLIVNKNKIGAIKSAEVEFNKYPEYGAKIYKITPVPKIKTKYGVVDHEVTKKYDTIEYGDATTYTSYDSKTGTETTYMDDGIRYTGGETQVTYGWVTYVETSQPLIIVKGYKRLKTRIVRIGEQTTPTPTPEPGDEEIAGTVWLDAIEGKQEDRDNVLTEKDTLLAGIKVTLYKENGEKVAETVTDTNGHYVFKNVSKTEKYKVTFEYGGYAYTPVQAISLNSEEYKDKDKSAGREITDQRNNINNSLHEIIKGTARNVAGENTSALEYNRNQEARTSTLKTIGGVEVKQALPIIAETESFSASAEYSKYINLGLIERPQVNLGLMTDVTKVEVITNGNTETYDYSQRDEKTAISLEAKKAEMDLDRKYNASIYVSDYNFRIEDYNANNEVVVPDNYKSIEAYVTYKIKVKNYSSNSAKVSMLKTYYDASYELEDSWYAKTIDKNEGKITWSEGSSTNGYKTITTASAKDVELKANEDLYVYVKFHVLKDRKGLINTAEKYIVTEIAGYTTEQGVIDINSEPDNVSVNSWEEYKNTMEDDTDRAPGLILPIEQIKRGFSGVVWEDKATETVDGIKTGNGQKDADEVNAEGVIVQLIELVTLEDGEHEYIWQETVTGAKGSTYTSFKKDESGNYKTYNAGEVMFFKRDGSFEKTENVSIPEGANYSFADYVSGKYIVRFIYGETIKGNKVQYSGQDYKATTYTAGFGANTSSAKDNKERRLATMKYSVDQDNATAEILANEGANPTVLAENTWMYADTVDEIIVNDGEDDEGRTINLGLVERPKSKLVAIKEIEGVKISNKGIVYVDTAASKTNAQIADPSNINLELDDEILNGATLEVTYRIKVRNEGEADTLYNYFEGETVEGLSEYMEKIGVSNQKDIIKTGATLVYDYPDKMGLDSKTTGWTKDNVETNILKQNVKKYIADNNQLVVKGTDGNLYEKLEPGSESEKWSLVTFSKILSVGGNDNFTYDNKVEIVARSNGVGRRDSGSRPGNYVPSEDPEVEPDTDNAKLTITDPKGQARIYFVLGFVSLTMVIAGVILIKKRVLTK